MAVVFCLASCGSSNSSDDPEPTPTPTPTPDNPTGKVAFLTAKEFSSTEWSGKDGDSQDVTLKVTSTTEMTLNYYEKTTLSKNTEPSFELKTATITYTFDEAKGTFSGNDGNTQYSGTLTSKTALTLKMPTAEVSLTKK